MLHNDVSTFLKKTVLVSSLAFLLLLVAAHSPLSPAQAASAPYLVKDINPKGSSGIQNLTVWHNRLYFQVIVTPHKNGIWMSDGTTAGTTRVKPIQFMYGFSKTKKYLYFMANDGTHGYEPWVSDGTRGGTHLIKDLTPPNTAGNTVLIGSAGNLGYFLEDNAADDYLFWRTNGMERGTRTIAEQLVVEGGVPLGKTLYFPATERAFLKKNLWKSDGTAHGTQLVKQLTPASSTEIWDLNTHAGKLWFFSTDNTLELWQSDGSTQGTVPVKAIGTNVYFERGEWAGNLFFFVLDNLNTGHYELWVSDGTENGTQMIYDMGSSDHVFPPHIKGVGNVLYFAFEFGALYKTDGTTQGTTKVSDVAVLYEMASVGSLLFFANTDLVSGGVYLYQSDGTAQGTIKIGDTRPMNLTGVKDTLFFTTDDGIHGQELWAYKP